MESTMILGKDQSEGKRKGFVPSHQSVLIDHVRPTYWLVKSGYQLETANLIYASGGTNIYGT